MKKLLPLLLILTSSIGFASPITVDVISAPQGLTIQNQNANLTLPTGYVTEKLLSQSNTATVSNKTFDASSNVYKQAMSIWDATVQGGGTGVYQLTMGLPINAVILEAFADVITQPTGGGTGLYMSCNAAYDILTQTSNLSLKTGQYLLSPRGGNASSSTMIKTTAATNCAVTIPSGSLNGAFTSGKIAFFINYVISQ